MQELFEFYGLEGFLRRLSRTSYASSFALKGGELIAAYSDRRATRDVDLAGIDVGPELHEVLKGYGLVAQPRWRRGGSSNASKTVLRNGLATCWSKQSNSAKQSDTTPAFDQGPLGTDRFGFRPASDTASAEYAIAAWSAQYAIAAWSAQSVWVT